MTKPTFSEEQMLWENGISNVIGLDEVGRGAFAGPIVAAGVIFKSNIQHEFLGRVNDSKLIKPKLREELSILIKENSIWEIEQIDIDFINKFGIGKANREVFDKVISKLLSKLKSNNYFLLIDGFDLKILYPTKPWQSGTKQKAIINGDKISLSIASASIIAKVFRDDVMRKASGIYPNYLFAKNKGYGTLEHRNAIKLNGLCDLHRTSFDLDKFL